MSRFKKHYQYLSTQALVTVIEEPHRYNPDVIRYCKTLIEEKNETKDVLKEFAKMVFYNRFYTYFRNGGHWAEDSIKETSFFLTKSELNYCYNTAKIAYTSYIEGVTRSLPSG
ncbi:hypothetical protein [Psychroserpens damuponensis]|uniref:hypothetical protein n=1 Tax=Psychroserpens damuponensis TaxID=943936 RepID=UPI00058F1801|nr:hypothetical protein [Psychroserpens damuponensis]